MALLLPPCWLRCSNCGAIVVPRNAWCSQRSGRWHVPTNEEKTPCVNFISSFQNFRHLSFRLEGLCNRIVPIAEQSTDFRTFSYRKHRPTDLFGEGVWKRMEPRTHETDSALRRRHLLSTLTGSGCTCGGYAAGRLFIQEPRLAFGTDYQHEHLAHKARRPHHHVSYCNRAHVGGFGHPVIRPQIKHSLVENCRLFGEKHPNHRRRNIEQKRDGEDYYDVRIRPQGLHYVHNGSH